MLLSIIFYFGYLVIIWWKILKVLKVLLVKWFVDFELLVVGMMLMLLWFINCLILCIFICILCGCGFVIIIVDCVWLKLICMFWDGCLWVIRSLGSVFVRRFILKFFVGVVWLWLILVVVEEFIVRRVKSVLGCDYCVVGVVLEVGWRDFMECLVGFKWKC